MSIPIKHHYLPAFFIERWANADGRVVEFSRPYRRLVARRRFATETGYQPHLYSIPTRADPAHRQELESRFLSRVDDVASNALAYFEAHSSPPTDQHLRSGWSRFLMSLMHRHPRQIEFLWKHLREGDAKWMSEVEATYDDLRAATDPPTFAEYLATDENGVVSEAFASLFSELVDSPRVGSVLNGSVWGFARVPSDAGEFLTSDSPLVMNRIGQPDGYLLLAVSPKSFFVASQSREVVDFVGSQPPSALVQRMNQQVAAQAHHQVIARDSGARAFVDPLFLPFRRRRLPDLVGLPPSIAPYVFTG